MSWLKILIVLVFTAILLVVAKSLQIIKEAKLKKLKIKHVLVHGQNAVQNE